MSDVRTLPEADRVVARVVDLAREAVAAQRLEFATFVLGVRVRRLARGLPEAAVAEWKGRIKRGAGLELGLGWDAEPDFRRAHLVVVYDVDRDEVELKVRPVLLYGRYRKLARGLPQTRTRWACPECVRKGCEVCGGTGRRFPVSVEDLLGVPAVRAFDGKGRRPCQLHGLGREDVDVRCLGSGRPFVLEVCRPRRREVDLELLARDIRDYGEGQVELSGPLRAVEDEVLPRVKNWVADKVYAARCRLAAPVAPERVRALEAELSGVVLAQRTPERVAHRRVDKVRRRRVHAFEVTSVAGAGFAARVRAESGTYIKELISSDEGRTEPSVAGLLGLPALCEELDVLEILADDRDLLAPPSPATDLDSAEPDV